jgi:hypothetical protein
LEVSIYLPYAKERFEKARLYSILHPERIVGNSQPWDFFLFARQPGAIAITSHNPTSQD